MNFKPLKARLSNVKIINKLIVLFSVNFEKYLYKYKYNPEKYPESFIAEKEISVVENLEKAKKIIYVFWTGDNELTENRKYGLETLTANSGVEVQLVTTKNLKSYILDDFPFHPAYENLSLVHKADYLRCYFMYHHGGGYSDIKPCFGNWNSAFDQLNSDAKMYALGYQEILGGATTISNKYGLISKHVKWFFFKQIGVCAFIFKPKSPLAKEWLDELHVRLDFYQERLLKNDTSNYPIPWSFILSQILGPLCFKYNKFILQNSSIQPIFKNYR